MNNRIEQLAEQANLKLDDLPDEVFIPLKEFAELIVRECANIANSGIDPAESHLIGDDILEHFGIEE